MFLIFLKIIRIGWVLSDLTVCSLDFGFYNFTTRVWLN